MSKKTENKKNRPIVKRILTNKIFITAISIICLYAVSGFFLAPYLIVHKVPGVIADKLDREIRMGKVRVNPFLMTLESNDFRLNEKDGSPIVGYQRVFIDFQLSSLFRWAWTFKTFRLEHPVVHVVVEADGGLNLAEMIPESSSVPDPPSNKEDVSKPPRLILQKIEIAAGRIHVVDRRPSTHAEIEIHPLNISLNEISTLPEKEGPYSLVAATADGESFRWTGDLTLHPFQSKGRLSFDNIRASTPWKFARDAVMLEKPEGLLGLDTNYTIQLGGDKPQIALRDLNFRIRGLGLQLLHDESPFFELPAMDISAPLVDLAEKRIDVEFVIFDGGDINIVRDADGSINLTRLPARDTAEKTVEPEPRQIDTAEPWQFLVKTVKLNNFTTAFSDWTVKPDAPLLHIDNLKGTISTIDGKSPMRVHTAFGVRQGGTIDISGMVNPTDLTAQADILINELALPTFQPYVEPYVNLGLATGGFSTKGKLLYGGQKATPKLGYEGEVGFSGLQLLETATGNLFLGWKNLIFSKLKFSIQPDLLEIEDIKLAQMDSKFIISEDGTVNVADMVKRSEDEIVSSGSSDSSGQTDDAAFPITVHKFRIEDSRLFFADFSLIPQFATKIHQLEGMITGISSKPGSRTKIQLDGRVDDYGVSKINGAIDTFNPKEFTDIAVIFRNLEMTGMTPYSGKFVGRKIDSGKLSLDLKYYIEDKKLQGDNQIIVERIQLGDRVESPDAVTLPLNLAVALLEDSDGIIDIGLPVKGDLENPEFSFGPLIWKAFVNVIKKIASAPFRALGALLGGNSDDLDSVAFEAGMAAVPPPEIEKLVELAEALKKRPNLKLVVQGCYSDEMDGLAFRELNIRRTLSERMGLTLAPGEDPGPIDHDNANVVSTLSALFVERFGESELETVKDTMNLSTEGKTDDKKPADPKKATHDLRSLSEKIYTRLVESEPIDEALLKQLAGERTKHIIEELTVNAGLDADRVATKEVQRLEPQKPVKAKLDLTAMP